MKQNTQATESTDICTTQLSRESRPISSSVVHERGQQQCCLLQIMQPTSRLQAAPSLGVYETKSTDMHNIETGVSVLAVAIEEVDGWFLLTQ